MGRWKTHCALAVLLPTKGELKAVQQRIPAPLPAPVAEGIYDWKQCVWKAAYIIQQRRPSEWFSLSYLVLGGLVAWCIVLERIALSGIAIACRVWPCMILYCMAVACRVLACLSRLVSPRRAASRLVPCWRGLGIAVVLAIVCVSVCIVVVAGVCGYVTVVGVAVVLGLLSASV